MNAAMKLTHLLLVCAPLCAEAAAQTRAGSIYDVRRGPVMTLADKTARRRGDLVTVLVSEIQDIKNEERSDLRKTNQLDFALSNFNLAPNAFGTLPGVGSSKQDNFTGNANYEKKGRFQARLTAIVTDVLPGGNLVIQGRRELRIDDELKVLEFTGIVRRFDVHTDNTVMSESVADARVRYTGSGPLTKTTNRTGLSGWLHDAIDWIWPF